MLLPNEQRYSTVKALPSFSLSRHEDVLLLASVISVVFRHATLSDEEWIAETSRDRIWP